MAGLARSTSRISSGWGTVLPVATCSSLRKRRYHGRTSARNVKPRRSLHVHQEIHQRPRGIAEEGQQADASDVPEEADLLHAHGRDTRGRADDQTAAAGTGTEGQQLPEAAIDNEPTHPLGLG